MCNGDLNKRENLAYRKKYNNNNNMYDVAIDIYFANMSIQSLDTSYKRLV